MNYYKRKKLSKDLVKKLMNEGESKEKIIYKVSEEYHLSENWVEKYFQKILGYLDITEEEYEGEDGTGENS